jgi:hypothetical protein
MLLIEDYNNLETKASYSSLVEISRLMKQVPETEYLAPHGHSHRKN